ncbi:MAG: Peptidyl-prolyl cis-trans isomerase-like 1 [Marteilia pararefringens]
MTSGPEIIKGLGQLDIELYWEHAPLSCKNFASHCAHTYFIGCKFHRLAKDYIAQSGDPSNTGYGGQSIYGMNFKDEINQDLRFTGAGIVAMANSGPNQNASQFFITLGITPDLNDKYTIFGRVLKGIDVLSKINRVETKNNTPLEDIVIKNTYVMTS